MRIVVTRPAADAEATAAALRGAGHDVLIHPLLDVAMCPPPASVCDGASALIVTSRNALRALAASPALGAARALPVFCVGEATAAFARQLGFTDVRTGSGTAKELAAVILAAPAVGRGVYLYLTGDHLAFDLEAALTANGATVRREIVYETRELSGGAARQLVEKLREGVDGVMLMSPRTASVFARIWEASELTKETRALTCYCLSEAVAGPLRRIAGITPLVALRPSEADLLVLTGEAR